jgi:DNA polymerase IV (DinB-like DNA polymerase)
MENHCKKKRIILHVDMDHFFSAIEERENPIYKGKPVVVGADPEGGEGRGVVKTCNYIAREFGLHSGMPISRAWRLCPNAIYVRANYPLYKTVSAEIMTILRKYSDKFQRWGFDEAFLDVTRKVKEFEEAMELAFDIKHEILWKERITCSIGIAPNKLVAKIASDHVKPDGLTVVKEDDVERFLAPLPVRRMLWIGEKTERKLNEMGIKTIGDLASFDVSMLTKRFGIMGARYHQYAHGVYESEVGGRRGLRKSLGHERTFMINVNDYDLVLKRLNDLCQRVYEKTARRNLLFKTVTVKVRYGNFETHTYGETLPFFASRPQDLKKTVHKLVQNHLRGDETIRLIGVRVSNLKSIKEQRTLMAD